MVNWHTFGIIEVGAIYLVTTNDLCGSTKELYIHILLMICWPQ